MLEEMDRKKRNSGGIRMGCRIALAGNPNCGKTTLFNTLTGANQYVGNWPGVTVEKKEGHLKEKFGGSKETIVTDLPGIYSLSPYTLEEVVSRDYLLNENPDVIIDLVDATNIERNLYLTTQLIETGIPVVVALNMSDLLEKRGIKIDVARLSMYLDCPIVPTSALKGEGLTELLKKAIATADKKEHALPKRIFSNSLEEAIDKVEGILPADITTDKKRWYAVKFLEGDTKVEEQHPLSEDGRGLMATCRKDLESAQDNDIESIVTNERYDAIQKMMAKTVQKKSDSLTTSDRIDRIVTNRILGLPIFILTMFIVYYISVTTMGSVVTDWTNDVLVGAIQNACTAGLTALGASDLIISLLVDGVVGGVGAVIGFAPQMAILFLFLSILEDCGYMVRIAFVMDRIFRHFGLSGKSFIPLLISSGCGVPGIMSSKTIEQDNDRRLTIMTATFVPCGAKLPVIALMGGIIASYAATGNYVAAGWMAPLMYFIGISAVLVSAIMLKKTKPFSGQPAPFVMELPQYHVPQLRTVLMHVWERLRAFLKKAGTILVIATIVMWVLSTFGFENGTFTMVEDANASLLAIVGSVIAVLFRPLGFGTWQAVAASISGFTAKEAIVSTMGVLANVAGDTEDAATVAAGVGSWFNGSTMAAFSFLMFNLLDSPCLAAIGTIASEMNDRKWFWFAIAYQNIFAYVATLIVYQIGGLLMGELTFGAGSAAAILFLCIILFLLFRKDPYKEKRVYAKRSVAVQE